MQLDGTLSQCLTLFINKCYITWQDYIHIITRRATYNSTYSTKLFLFSFLSFKFGNIYHICKPNNLRNSNIQCILHGIFFLFVCLPWYLHKVFLKCALIYCFHFVRNEPQHYLLTLLCQHALSLNV